MGLDLFLNEMCRGGGGGGAGGFMVMLNTGRGQKNNGKSQLFM